MNSRFRFVGWCHGALHAAFMQCGLSFYPQNGLLAAPDKTRSARLEELRTYLASETPRPQALAVYCKDPAWAARKNGDKRSATQFCATVLSQLIQWADGRTILILSDHNSEPGRDETLTGATLAGLLATKSSELDRLRAAPVSIDSPSGRDGSAWQQEDFFDYLRDAWL